jgi:diguanylate cyclase (GGDEF)-like protein
MPARERDEERVGSIESALSADDAGLAVVPGQPNAQTFSDGDQTRADGDQTGADLDQSAADIDESASERDQLAADRDQVAADDDEAAARGHAHEVEPGHGYARSRQARSKSTHDRKSASRVRVQAALARDDAALRRDQIATERDDAARARDEVAASLDRQLDRLELEDGAETRDSADSTRRLRDRHRSGLDRTRAAVQRDAAAHDRELARLDRERAAADRATAAAELAAAGLDELTGTMLRRVGLGAMQREMDRTSRSGERLVIAYIDVDGLKAVNDTVGHLAGDKLLTDVARSISHHLRSYDVICRFGGDEFVCSLAGQDVGGADERFQHIRTRLSDASPDARITVGFTERGEDDTLEGLIARADEALIAIRTRPAA